MRVNYNTVGLDHGFVKSIHGHIHQQSKRKLNLQTSSERITSHVPVCISYSNEFLTACIWSKGELVSLHTYGGRAKPYETKD